MKNNKLFVKLFPWAIIFAFVGLAGIAYDASLWGAAAIAGVMAIASVWYGISIWQKFGE